ncbi:DUF1700 domain-containing protein [Anaerovorax sp. IOR16]|uniref:DUF1700 domain-containing protein n=1 Tax=Anaerovorax sp. IOR16 TaxID=2773458 RepID=UPI0019CFBEEF|nr:DUF1700 domain-containing protein [Anaerovorax sp. IOR16]
MSRAEFMRQLEDALSRVPKDERDSVLAYYNEYFDEAGEENEQEVLKELDSPQTIASKIMADVAAKTIGTDSMPTVKKGVSAIWLIILAIFAAPIALPVAIAVAACIFGLVVTVAAVMFAMLVSVLAVFIAGFVCLGTGFMGMFAQPLIGLGVVGLGCIMVGISLLIGILVVFAGRAIFGALAKVLSRALNSKSKGAK